MLWAVWAAGVTSAQPASSPATAPAAAATSQPSGPTEEHPVPNILKPTGQKRFFVSPECFVRNWAVLGLWSYDMIQFPTEHCVGETNIEVVKDEAAMRPRIGQEVEGRKWLIYSVPAAQEPQYLDATEFFKNIPNHVIYFVAADVYSPQEIKDAIFHFGCADAAKVYLNGKLIHTYDKARRAAEADSDTVKGLTLQKGWNLLLIKMGNIMHGSGLYARFATAQDDPIEVTCPKLTAKEGYQPPPKKPDKGKEIASVDLTGEWAIKADPKADGAKEKWGAEKLDESAWKKIKVPGAWEDTLNLSEKGSLGFYALAETWETSEGLYNGIAWYRRTVDVPKAWQGKRLFLELGAVSDYDWAYFNGAIVGTTDYGDYREQWWKAPRRYAIPEKLIHFGQPNTIAVQVFNINGSGGIMGPVVRLVAEEAAQ